jgi:hypothetical protein
MDAYRQSLEQWRLEQKRQFEEFIIDEKELEDRLVRFFFKLNIRNSKRHNSITAIIQFFSVQNTHQLLCQSAFNNQNEEKRLNSLILTILIKNCRKSRIFYLF